MSGSSPDLLPRLPSVSELLEKPQVKMLVRQLNQTTVAQGVHSYLLKLGEELQQRLGESSFPTPGELAERAARYVIGLNSRVGCRSVINATGDLFGHDWSSIPLSDKAQQAILEAAGGYTYRGSGIADEYASVSKLLCRSTTAEAATVLHSYEGALWLCLSSLASGREVLVARGQVDQSGGVKLADLVASSGAILREVGAANAVGDGDYQQAVSAATAVLFHARSDAYQVVGQVESACREQLVMLCRDHEVIFVEALDGTPLSGDSPAALADHVGLDDRASAKASLTSGADLALVRGDGLVGGPSCGIILGRREWVECITNHPLHAAWRIDPLRLAALGETLRRTKNLTDRVMSDLPIHQLVNTPLENLRYRSERLAVQLAASPVVDSADPVEIPPSDLNGRSEFASWGVLIGPRNHDLAVVLARLTSANPPIVGRQTEGALLLDLRTVHPKHDQHLVDVLLDEVSPVSDTVTGTAHEPH